MQLLKLIAGECSISIPVDLPILLSNPKGGIHKKYFTVSESIDIIGYYDTGGMPYEVPLLRRPGQQGR